MKLWFRACLAAAMLPLTLVFSGCSSVGSQIQAISDAVESYSDYYIEVRNLSDQVRAQASQSVDGRRTLDYTITVDIPDYASMDRSAVAFAPPAPDYSAQNAESYARICALTLRQALDQYALEHTVSAYVHLPVAISVSASGGWKANLSSQSKLEIQQTAENMIAAALKQDAVYQSSYHCMQVASALPGLLSDAFGGEAYARLIEISGLTQQPDGTYLALFSYLDPETVYDALANSYESSFNQPFYGDERTAVLSANELPDAELSQSAWLNASVTVTLDETTGECTLLDDGGLGAGIAQIRARAEADASAAVNAAWRIAPQTPPKSGAILEGESEGNSVVFQAGADLGTYFYVRFYAISSEDVSEEGTLKLGVFILGGKSASIHLPSGYYRVSCAVGESWYGLAELFGSDGTVYDGSNAVRSRKGYENTVSFG